MTSAAIEPATASGGTHADGYDCTLVTFASVVVAMIGTFNLMYGAASVANSRKFTAGINHILASVHWWGLVVVLLGLLQLLAAAGALLGNQLLCWVAATSAGTNAIGQVFFIFATGAYLPWFLTVIGVDMAAVYGLCVYGGRQAACALWDDSYRDRDVGVP